MTDFGPSEKGFRAKRFADVRASLQQRLSNVTDRVTGEKLQVDFDEDSPDVQIFDIIAEEIANVWEVGENIVRMFDPSAATGPVQSAQVQLNGIRRRPSLPSTISIEVQGNPGTRIDAGKRIYDSQQNITYLISSSILIGADGTATGQAISEEHGPLFSNAGAVTKILTPVTGWSGVINTADSILGQFEETDEELRLRRDLSTEVPSQGPVEALQGNLLQIDGVGFAAVYVNKKLVVDGRGLPPKTVTVVIQGGEDQEIAEVLFLRSAAGVNFNGNVSLVLFDKLGEPHEIRWVRPQQKSVYIEINTQVINPNLFGDGGAEAIKEALVTYAQSGARGLGIQDGFDARGFLPGEQVSRSRLYTPINSVAGHVVSSLKIGFAPEIVSDNDLPIGFDEIAIFDTARIIVNTS